MRKLFLLCASVLLIGQTMAGIRVINKSDTNVAVLWTAIGCGGMVENIGSYR